MTSSMQLNERFVFFHNNSAFLAAAACTVVVVFVVIFESLMTVFEGVEVRVQLVEFERIASFENGDKFVLLLGVVIACDSASDSVSIVGNGGSS